MSQNMRVATWIPTDNTADSLQELERLLGRNPIPAGSCGSRKSVAGLTAIQAHSTWTRMQCHSPAVEGAAHVSN
jgi:hypothetical protein